MATKKGGKKAVKKGGESEAVANNAIKGAPKARGPKSREHWAV